MKRNVCTFLIFPGTHGRLRKIHLPVYAVKLLLAFCAAGLMTAVSLANTYARMLFKVSSYNNLRTEREALESQYKRLETVAMENDLKLGSLESLAAEVGLANGFGDPRRSAFAPNVLLAATGGPSASGPSYAASLYAFNALKMRGLLPPAKALDHSLFLELLHYDSTTPSIWPVRGEISAGFGQRMDPFTGEGAFHAGVDIAAPVGTTVLAAADGILFHAGPDRGYGNEVLIDHGFGITTKYGHLATVCVRVGQQVKRGQIIGTVGMTGRATGPHLHYEVLIHDAPVNPAQYLRG